MTDHTHLIERLDPFVQGLGKAILREVESELEALQGHRLQWAAECGNELSKVEALQGEVALQKEFRDDIRGVHESMIVRIGEMCGTDLSSEPRAKWALIEVSSLIAERDQLRARLTALESQEPAGHFVAEEHNLLGKVTRWAQVVSPYGVPLFRAAGAEVAILKTALAGVKQDEQLLQARLTALENCLGMLVSYTEACEGLLNCKPAGQVTNARELLAAGAAPTKEQT